MSKEKVDMTFDTLANLIRVYMVNVKPVWVFSDLLTQRECTIKVKLHGAPGNYSVTMEKAQPNRG